MHATARVHESETVHLRDGTPALIRPVRPDDAPRLQSLFGRLSRESICYRFLGLRKEMTNEEARRLADLDCETQMALVATRRQGSAESVIGVARYAAVPGRDPAEAEAAVVVEDRYQGQGLGTHLLRRLAAYAVAHGVCTFLATVRHDNARVMRLIRRSGLPIQCKAEAGVLALRIGLVRRADCKASTGRARLWRDAEGKIGGKVPCLSEIV
jgi:acetyltransferase